MEFQRLIDVTPESANFIMENFLPIPKNAVTLLSASGGTGKTRLALLMADRHIKSTKEKVALWLTEDYPGQIRSIFDEMVENNLANKNSMENMLLIKNQPPQLAKREGGVFKANYEEITNIGKSMIIKDIKFAIFDPLLAFYGGNENDNSEARVFIQAFAEWAKTANITTLIIHHSNKDGASRGATAFHDGVRARYELDFLKDEKNEVIVDKFKNGFRVAKLRKDNWGIRKHLWRLTDGKDEIILKIMPTMDYKNNVEISEYEDKEFPHGAF